MWIQDRPLVKLHLGEVPLEQGFQLKIRGNTSTQKKRGEGSVRVWVPHVEAEWALFQTMCSVRQHVARKKKNNLLMEKNNFYIDIIPVLV